MNAVVRLERSGFNEDGVREYTFSTNSSLYLDKDKTYVMNLNEKKPPRSLAQSAMWHSLLDKICIELDGNTKDRRTYHNQLMDMAGVETRIHDYYVNQQEYDKLTNQKTDMKVIQKGLVNHAMFYHIKVYESSDKYNSAEMSRLIDVTLDYAAELGIETDYWRDLLNV